MALSFVLHHSVKSDQKKVIAFFENIQLFAAVHPFILQAIQQQEHEFIIRERMPLTFIRFHYRSDVFLHNGNEVHYIAYPFFLVLTIKFKFNYLKEEQCTHIAESVHIKGPQVFAYVLKLLVTYAHKKLIRQVATQLNTEIPVITEVS